MVSGRMLLEIPSLGAMPWGFSCVAHGQLGNKVQAGEARSRGSAPFPTGSSSLFRARSKHSSPLPCAPRLPMPGVRFHEVRSLVSMAQVLELLGFVANEASGDELRGPCPVHGSSPKSRSFSANVKKGAYRCFRCGSAGNHLDLYTAATQQSLHAAAVDLCQRLGCAVPWVMAR